VLQEENKHSFTALGGKKLSEGAACA